MTPQSIHIIHSTGCNNFTDDHVFNSFFCSLQRDRKRQEQLAKERLEQRKKAARAAKEARKRGESGPEGSLLQQPTVMSVVPMPENENDKSAMQEVVVKELEMKHVEERNLLIQVYREHVTKYLNIVVISLKIFKKF